MWSPLKLKLGMVHWKHSHVVSYEHWGMHKVFVLPQTPPIFLFCICCRSELNDLNYLIVEKPNKTPNRQKGPKQNKKWRTGEPSVPFLPSSHCSGSSQTSSIRLRIFRLLFGTCLLYLLRVRCCQVEEKKYLYCLSLTSYTCIFVFWFLRKERKCFSSKLPSERNTQERNTPVR